MPHKHKRNVKDLTTFDLDPSQQAKPLPVTTVSKRKAAEKNKGVAPPERKGDDPPRKKDLKRKSNGEGVQDDAPRAFKRLMAFAGGRKTRDGLDDGNGKMSKKERAAKNAALAEAEAKAATKKEPKPKPGNGLTIMPGERLSEFNSRVDQALPILGLVGKSKVGKDPLGLKIKRTKKEKKMHKMYDEWRVEDAKRKEKMEEEAEEREEQEMENDAMGVTWKLDLEDQQGKKKKNKGGKKHIGEDRGKEEDPWAEIIRKRGETKIGLHDVAKAPPDLRKAPPKLLVRGAAVEVNDIPKAAGSLRQREELQGIRDDVVAGYRLMMEERRAAAPKKGEGEGEDGQAKKEKGTWHKAR
ncbi:hypothetical protein B0T22DRAFT_465794 [Podospora appendiculata]|uniref:Uncharacterized protein n=1 Tax=Podospora appendiculata TaxID=314037 RepID=A0AAE0X5B1_9PEZI|nr:hypothetical protein B0T22DRAFT_465794 [Podospora appendiculata]